MQTSIGVHAPPEFLIFSSASRGYGKRLEIKQDLEWFLKEKSDLNEAEGLLVQRSNLSRIKCPNPLYQPFYCSEFLSSSIVTPPDLFHSDTSLGDLISCYGFPSLVSLLKEAWSHISFRTHFPI